MTANPDSHPDSVAPTERQFGLGAMLGCFVALGMALAYLQNYNSLEVFQNGVIVTMLAVAWGAIVGIPTGRRRDGIFWALVICTAGYLSVVGETRYGAGFHFAWAGVGAGAGGAAGVIRSGLGRRMLAGCLGGSLPMAVFVAFSRQGGFEFDLLTAVIVAALIGVLVELIMWLERGSKIPRYLTASWLLCAVIVGNLLVPLVLA